MQKLFLSFYAHAEALGYHLVTLAELRQRGITALAAELGERLAELGRSTSAST